MIDSLEIGSEIENKKIAEIFLCSNQGGIRKSKKTKTIVMIAKFTNCGYKHRWEDETLYFVGMGKKGNQEMKRQNKSVLNASEEGFTLHLFEMYKESVYTYSGEVILKEQPFIERHLDDNGLERDAIIFPLIKKTNNKKYGKVSRIFY